MGRMVHERKDFHMKRKRGRTILLIAMAIFFVVPIAATGASASNTVTLPLFEPEGFFRDTGGPDVEARTFTIPAIEGSFTLSLENGSAAGDSLASAAVVKVNGFMVIKTSDLSQQVTYLEKDLAPYVNEGENVLEVEVRSIPSSYITISIDGEYHLDVQVTDPVTGTSLDGDQTTVQGTWLAYTSDIGIVVNGVPAALSGGTFVASDVPLVAGTNTLKATITTFEEIKDTDSVEIVATNYRPAAELNASIASGVAPLKVDFRTEAAGIDVVEYLYDFDGNGTPDMVTTTDEYVEYTYYSPGVYPAEVTVTDGETVSYSATTLITIDDKAALNGLLSNRWTDMRNKLSVQEVGEATSFFSARTLEKYNNLFTELKVALPQMAADMGDMELIYVRDRQAKYRLHRDEDGVLTTYYVYFIKEPNGLWRIIQF